jgi:hypothetical protein
VAYGWWNKDNMIGADHQDRRDRPSTVYQQKNEMVFPSAGLPTHARAVEVASLSGNHWQRRRQDLGRGGSFTSFKTRQTLQRPSGGSLSPDGRYFTVSLPQEEAPQDVYLFPWTAERKSPSRLSATISSD